MIYAIEDPRIDTQKTWSREMGKRKGRGARDNGRLWVQLPQLQFFFYLLDNPAQNRTPLYLFTQSDICTSPRSIMFIKTHVTY